MKTKKAVLMIIIVSAALIAACTIAARIVINNFGITYFADRFLPGTYINNVDCSLLTAEQAKLNLQQNIGEYEIELVERGDQSEYITGEELGLTYVDDGSLDELINAQDTELWLYYLDTRGDYNLPASFDYDETYVPFLVEELNCMKSDNVIEPEDAYIEQSSEGFYIVPEIKGTKVDRDKLVSLIEDAVATGTKTIDMDTEGAYVEPAATSESETLLASLTKANNLISADITYDFVDRQYRVDKDTIMGWLVKTSDGSYGIDETLVSAWVDQMAYDTDTFGLPRYFMTTYGVPIQLEGGGDYGWATDNEATTAKLIQHLYAGDVIVTQPEYVFTACDRSSNDIGGRYVEVCIEDQHLWAYDNYQLIADAPVVTGCPAINSETPSGSVWAIDAKMTDFEFTYFPGCTARYWMPFNGECGIHDSDWRSHDQFGGDLYLWNGSHGCVNTWFEAAEAIFNHMYIGDPVVVYYSLSQVHGTDPTAPNLAG
ncbi:MAG: L,D-transpeptidase/peptidoglycan binding protein [Lachnospiraceae bacterium]|nr:L,D-transpeptidase/peptidoglycan binding protein [Lachnospiraceae bacterium]